ncbi:unnamed protein product [Amoebophrya sp. A120]|nr:unnamed protein product [Amoebophrya sp. A120]|eukprot:GSA120T00017900001.1
MQAGVQWHRSRSLPTRLPALAGTPTPMSTGRRTTTTDCDSTIPLVARKTRLISAVLATSTANCTPDGSARTSTSTRSSRHSVHQQSSSLVVPTNRSSVVGGTTATTTTKLGAQQVQVKQQEKEEKKRLRKMQKEADRVRKEQEAEIGEVGEALKNLVQTHIGFVASILQKYPQLEQGLGAFLSLSKGSDLVRVYIMQQRVLPSFFPSLPYSMRVDIERRLGGMERVKAGWQVERCLQLLMTDDSGLVTPAMFAEAVARVKKTCEDLGGMAEVVTASSSSASAAAVPTDPTGLVLLAQQMSTPSGGAGTKSSCSEDRTRAGAGAAAKDLSTSVENRKKKLACFLLEHALRKQLEAWDHEIARIEQDKWQALYTMMDERFLNRRDAAGNPVVFAADDENYLLDLRDELMRRMELENGVYGLILRRAKTSYANARLTMEKRVPMQPYEVTVPDFASALDLVERARREIEEKIAHFARKAEDLHAQILQFISRRKLPDWVHVPVEREDHWRDVWDAVAPVEVFEAANTKSPKKGKLQPASPTGKKQPPPEQSRPSRSDSALMLMQRLDRMVQLVCDVKEEIEKKCPIWEIDGPAVGRPLGNFVQHLSELSERLLEILDHDESETDSEESSSTSTPERCEEGTNASGEMTFQAASSGSINTSTTRSAASSRRSSVQLLPDLAPQRTTTVPGASDSSSVQLRKLCKQWDQDFRLCLQKHQDPVSSVFEEHGPYFVRRRNFLSLSKFRAVAESCFAVRLHFHPRILT